MPRPTLPGTVWVHTRVKMTQDEYDRFKAHGAAKRMTDAAVMTEAARMLVARVPSATVKAFYALAGHTAPKAKAKRAPAPPPSKKGKRPAK